MVLRQASVEWLNDELSISLDLPALVKLKQLVVIAQPDRYNTAADDESLDKKTKAANVETKMADTGVVPRMIAAWSTRGEELLHFSDDDVIETSRHTAYKYITITDDA